MAKKKSKWDGLLLLLSLTAWTSCQPAASQEPLAVSARTLTQEYERSRANVRSKYDGKEITVRGAALAIPEMPGDGDDQGSVMLDEQDPNPRRVVCWFSQSQSEQFSRVKAGQLITVSGVFNGEAGVDLKFCKLVNIE